MRIDARWFQSQSTLEICDYIDNDCDAANDEGFSVGSYCDTGMFGECTDGVIVCGAPTSAIPSMMLINGVLVPERKLQRRLVSNRWQVGTEWNTSISYFLRPDNTAVGDFTMEAEIRSFDDDSVYLIWNYATNSNRDYVRFWGGNSNAIGNETVSWTEPGLT